MIYLCRRQGDANEDILSSHAWSQTGNRNGKHWFTPYDASTIAELHDWLTADCGLQLPDAKYETTSQTVARDIRYSSHSQVLSHQAD
jgi:hypothetical protein